MRPKQEPCNLGNLLFFPRDVLQRHLRVMTLLFWRYYTCYTHQGRCIYTWALHRTHTLFW